VRQCTAPGADAQSAMFPHILVQLLHPPGFQSVPHCVRFSIMPALRARMLRPANRRGDMTNFSSRNLALRGWIGQLFSTEVPPRPRALPVRSCTRQRHGPSGLVPRAPPGAARARVQRGVGAKAWPDAWGPLPDTHGQQEVDSRPPGTGLANPCAFRGVVCARDVEHYETQSTPNSCPSNRVRMPELGYGCPLWAVSPCITVSSNRRQRLNAPCERAWCTGRHLSSPEQQQRRQDPSFCPCLPPVSCLDR